MKEPTGVIKRPEDSGVWKHLTKSQKKKWPGYSQTEREQLILEVQPDLPGQEVARIIMECSSAWEVWRRFSSRQEKTWANYSRTERERQTQKLRANSATEFPSVWKRLTKSQKKKWPHYSQTEREQLILEAQPDSTRKEVARIAGECSSAWQKWDRLSSEGKKTWGKYSPAERKRQIDRMQAGLTKEKLEKRNEKIKKRTATPESKKLQRDGTTEAMRRPEIKAKTSAASINMWAERKKLIEAGRAALRPRDRGRPTEKPNMKEIYDRAAREYLQGNLGYMRLTKKYDPDGYYSKKRAAAVDRMTKAVQLRVKKSRSKLVGKVA